ncbi:CPBP family intramembrane glutamic endopeptidase [Streptomyces phaeochromogenes]|uniref:CPBP family intramembrane glutamic endopeptidase n=1 Tax=Streptomyces phaeochromogenes TaxID=1923 RepID=UPI00386C1578|nr:CPBP family intramembrane metalloprotease [Streptomyces phaeochromogenes]
MNSPFTSARTGPSPGPATDQPPASGSAARGYATVLALYALAGGPHMVSAVLAAVQLHGGTVPAGALRVEEVGRLIGLAVAAIWLLWLILTRPRPAGAQLPWPRVVVLVGALAVIAADEAGEFAADRSSTQVAGHLAELVIWVWLCIGAAARCGVTLQQLKPPALKRLFSKHTKAERAKGELVFYTHAAVLCTAVWLMSVLKRLPGPDLEGDQATAAGVPDLGPHLAHGIWSATVEELLATALVVGVLTAVRRPLWESLAVAALMRALPHAYLGLLPMLATLLPGITAGWLYHRYRRVIPLVLAHAAYNTLNILFGVPLLPMTVLLLLSAFWAWIATKTASPRAVSRARSVD